MRGVVTGERTDHARIEHSVETNDSVEEINASWSDNSFGQLQND